MGRPQRRENNSWALGRHCHLDRRSNGFRLGGYLGAGLGGAVGCIAASWRGVAAWVWSAAPLCGGFTVRTIDRQCLAAARAGCAACACPAPFPRSGGADHCHFELPAVDRGNDVEDLQAGLLGGPGRYGPDHRAGREPAAGGRRLRPSYVGDVQGQGRNLERAQGETPAWPRPWARGLERGLQVGKLIAGRRAAICGQGSEGFFGTVVSGCPSCGR